ncbi:hypothetical protein RF11_16061 [Thelohanellus kitauei]|uniref:Uncharacterized protein n=1 Tax=Thelohanellus kitauei TaxID=669202 RepID=A0A0C2J997_THEKT|nr:hypothetical protein RF11_16061 [Thelohanellus kitauei]
MWGVFAIELILCSGWMMSAVVHYKTSSTKIYTVMRDKITQSLYDKNEFSDVILKHYPKCNFVTFATQYLKNLPRYEGDRTFFTDQLKACIDHLRSRYIYGLRMAIISMSTQMIASIASIGCIASYKYYRKKYCLQISENKQETHE